MRTSARNTFHGVVRKITESAINAEVILKVSDSLEIAAVITRESVEALGLAVGSPAIALVKTSFVILMSGDDIPPTSARNRLTGTVSRYDPGAINDEVVIDLDDGETLVAIITKESGRAMELGVGSKVTALIKAPHVILAVD
jgi:molybdate transport system regulatory protein